VTAAQERRLRELRARLLARAFDHRQRGHARGVWFRLRRVLALAQEAHAIPRDEAERLVAEGHAPNPVGGELEPPRIIVLVPAERVARIASARRGSGSGIPDRGARRERIVRLERTAWRSSGRKGR